MSGLLAVFQRNGAAFEPHQLSAAFKLIAYRGRDYQEQQVAAPVALGIACTHWTEESRSSAQPFSLDGVSWVISASLLTGRSGLVNALRQKGESCSVSAPDHELIWRSYRAWGAQCVRHLTGEFSFVVWNGASSTLFSAVDHFATLPLFYALDAQRVLVSNELDAILACGGVDRTLDPAAVADTLVHQFQQSNTSTIYQVIRRLPPGQSLLVNPKTAQLTAYWQPGPAPAYRSVKAPGVLADEFYQHLSTAVLERNRTGRAGIELSGGLDTSSIAQILSAATAGSSGLAAFSHGFAGPAGEREPGYAGRTAAALGLKLHTSWMDKQGDFATTRPSCFPPEPQHFLWDGALEHGQNAARHAPVLFSGHGGDMLLGYVEYHWLAQLLSRPGGAARDLRSHFEIFGFKRPPLGIRRALSAWQNKQSPPTRLPDWLTSEFSQQAGQLDCSNTIRRHPDLYRQRLGMYHSPVSAMIFSRTDASYYRAPIRNTYPFFDLRLWNFIATVPPVPYLVKKALLRLAMKNRLPDEIVLRPKKHLAVATSPILDEILRRGVPAWYFEQLGSPRLAPYVQGDLVRRQLRHPEQLSKQAFLQIMSAVHLGAWLDEKQL